MIFLLLQTLQLMALVCTCDWGIADPAEGEETATVLLKVKNNKNNINNDNDDNDDDNNNNNDR